MPEPMLLDSRAIGLPLFGLRFTLEAAEPWPCLGFHGSWLRGFLGHALSQGVCVHPVPQCDDCALQDSCAYPQVFKPHLVPGTTRLPGYVLHEAHMPTGQRRGHCTLILIGKAAAFAETWVRSVAEHAPTLGMPRALGGRLLTVHDVASGALLFGDGRFQSGACLHTLLLDIPEGTVTLHFETPLVSKHDLGADPLWGPLRTRIRRLFQDYGDRPLPHTEEKPWQVVSAVLKPQVIPRGTNHSRPVRGLVGLVHLEALTAEGAQWVALGRYVHAGGETSLGCGRYRWKAVASAEGLC